VFLAIDIDFATLEQEKDWPLLLEAIWDVSGGAASDASMELVHSLIVGPRRMH
jgi:hypothetical protein